MTIYQRMAAVFERAGVPGFLQEWRATPAYPQIPERYATYQVVRSGSALEADDAQIVSVNEVTIDLYGETDVSNALMAVMAELEADGFCVSDVRDMDNSGATRYIYHRRWRAQYYSYEEWMRS